MFDEEGEANEPARKASQDAGTFLQRIVLENYDHYYAEMGAYGQNILKFTDYNGPSRSRHSTKKLMVPFIILPSIRGDKSRFKTKRSTEDPFSRDKFVACFVEMIKYALKSGYGDMLNEQYTRYTREELAALAKFELGLRTRLGVNYFIGRSFNWVRLYDLVELEYALQGIKIQNAQKGMSLVSSFNAYKGVFDTNSLVKFIGHRLGLRLSHRRKLFFLELALKRTKSRAVADDSSASYLVEFSFKLRVRKIYRNPVKHFSLVYMRDRRDSCDKLDGTYLDVFDAQLELAESESVGEEELRELAMPGAADLDELLVRSPCQQYLVVHATASQNFEVKSLVEVDRVQYERERAAARRTPMNFFNYYVVNEETVCEYGKKHADSAEDEKAEQTGCMFGKTLIANSVVSAEFRLNKWLAHLNNERANDLLERGLDAADDETSSSMNAALGELGLFLFEQAVAISDRVNWIYRQALDWRLHQLDWFCSMFRDKAAKIDRSKLSTVKYSFQDRFVDFDTMSLLRKITYSKSHLEVFDYNVNTISQFSAEELDRSYAKIMRLIVGDERPPSSSAPSKALVGHCISKVALRKLNEAYDILKDDETRKAYVENLRTLRRYNR